MPLGVPKVTGRSMMPLVMTLSLVNPNKDVWDRSRAQSPELYALEDGFEDYIGRTTVIDENPLHQVICHLGFENYSVIVRMHNTLILFVGEVYRLMSYVWRFLIGEVDMPSGAFLRCSP